MRALVAFRPACIMRIYRSCVMPRRSCATAMPVGSRSMVNVRSSRRTFLGGDIYEHLSDERQRGVTIELHSPMRRTRLRWVLLLSFWQVRLQFLKGELPAV